LLGASCFGGSINTWIADANGNIGQVNVSTGVATLVGNAGVVLTDIAFSPTGALYDTSTGSATDIGSLSGYGSAGDLAFVDGSLYLATSSNNLVTVNPSTGAATLVGPFGVSNVFGLATPDNVNLYAAAGEDLYTVNPSTGVATFDVTWAGNAAGLGGTNGQAFPTESGYTPSSTPEPATLALFAAGFGLLGLRRLFKH
jgi:hypothetical protein